MNDFSKTYTEDEDGFNGNCEAYLIESSKSNLLNWLKKEVFDADRIYSVLKELTTDILIIKNINVEEEFQGQGNGGQILCDLLNNSFADAAILVCDIAESQKEGFVLEKFYEENNFKTILMNNDYPLMIYPIELAEIIIEKLNVENKVVKPKI